MAQHRDLVDGDLHKPGYVQSADPGAVGSGRLWVDQSGGSGTWKLKLRNDADADWEGVTVEADAIWLKVRGTSTYVKVEAVNDGGVYTLEVSQTPE